MNQSTNPAPVAERIVSNEIWQYESGFNRRVTDVAGATRDALRGPIDFPPLTAAILPGERIALAVDPNVPEVGEVIRGVLLAIEEADCEAIDIVLWDETSDELLQQLQSEFETIAHVTRHDAQKRDSLRYLGVDVDDEPIYLSRFLVDADLVLPVLAARAWDAAGANPLSGVYPMLADSNTRLRHQKTLHSPAAKPQTSNESQVGWMLGVQIMLAVAANSDGEVGAVFAGTPDGIRPSFERPRQEDDECPPAPLVVATIEGSKQQQSWANFSRAIAVAATHAAPGGTIVIWSDIEQPASDRLVMRLSSERDFGDLDSQNEESEDDAIAALGQSDDGFTIWDDSIAMARSIERVRCEYRVLFHSKLGMELAESLGLGAIESLDALEHLSGSFEGCGILRAAQFAGGTFDEPPVH
ncbi:hypothetical protein Pla52o_07660 [Novipirellula galeiformis]|uniref:Uncharacterized protein n=1 Tax=Novipirellula galeiformis TaxID=2528004 RepID=A0A5C6CQS8_9BACT|nr:lactate racemase domain-containing protein [Novipirellula galeiformis]TWU26910.1 hypothetical protein Pla52o_07660 [Novipirellula galeiformis]